MLSAMKRENKGKKKTKKKKQNRAQDMFACKVKRKMNNMVLMKYKTHPNGKKCGNDVM